jgi:uncharacterized membrane protein YfcA
MPGLESLSLTVLLWIVAVMALAGLVQGALGFGFPFVATPLVAMASDMRTAIIMVLLPTIATNLINTVTGGPLRPVLARFWTMPIYAMVGSFAGTWLFIITPGTPYSLLLALIIIGYLNLDRISRGDWPLVRRHERVFAPLAGVAGGIFEGTVNVAVPPLIIFYLALELTPAMLVQALNICFLVGKSTQFAVLTARGGVTAAQWLSTLPLVLIGMAGFLAGARVRNRIDALRFRVWVKRALLVIALALLAQYAYQQLAGAA